MAMIGSYFGWQTAILVFFVAPFAGVLIAIAQVMFTRQPEIAFGPFLCAAAVFVLLRWDSFWNQWGPLFGLGWLIPVILLVCILLPLATSAPSMMDKGNPSGSLPVPHS